MWLVGLQTGALPCSAMLQSPRPFARCRRLVSAQCALWLLPRDTFYITLLRHSSQTVRPEWAGFKRCWGPGTQWRPDGCLLNEQRCTEQWMVCPWHLRGWPMSHAPTWGRQAGSTGGFVHPAGPAGEEGRVTLVTRDRVCSALWEALT